MTDLYMVVGNPIAHSKSPQIHSMFAEQTGQDLIYEKQQVEAGEFVQVLNAFQHLQGRGMNVTVPYKHEAWEAVDELSPRAQRAGAVNTIQIREDGSRYGDNTDGIGLLRDLTANHEMSLKDKNILIMGAGGAVRGILEPLLNEKPTQISIANRTPERAEELAEEFADLGNIEGGGFDELDGEHFDLIINGTAASLQGEMPPLPFDILAPDAVCYDLMYSREPTPFMRWGEEFGAARVLDGLGMLVEQAAESFELWRGVHPNTAPVIRALR